MNATGCHTINIKRAALLAALFFCAIPRASLAALPPAVASEAELAVPEVKAQQTESLWALLPPVQLGGKISYLNRRDTGDSGESNVQGLGTALAARTNVPVWQPWFGILSGAGELGVMRTSSQAANAVSYSSENDYMAGNVQLSMVPLSRFPFEAHATRNDSRNSSSLSALDGYTSKNAGFSQNYRWQGGNAMFGWDRNTQSTNTQNISAQAGEYRQNHLKFDLQQDFGTEQAFRLHGNSMLSTQENSDQLSRQNGWNAAHSFRRDTEVNVETMADTSRTRYRLLQPDMTILENENRQTQVNSHAVWKPADEPFSVNGGVRVLTLSSQYGDGIAGNTNNLQLESTNLNCGATYDFTKAIQFTGSANVNLTSRDNAQNTSSSESAAINYRQDPIALGRYQYMLSGSGTASNNHNENSEARQYLLARLMHNLNRNIDLGPGSALTAQAGQGVTSSWGNLFDPSQQLTHSALLAWNATQGDGTSTLLQLSASDERSWGANPGYFQMLNFQATGNMSTGRYSSWSGSLTIQTSRQVYDSVRYTNLSNTALAVVGDSSKFLTTSSGGVAYRNQRLFDVSRLLFTSDLRLNSQAFLPMLSGPADNESASWDNRVEYDIGRIQLRFNARAAKNGNSLNKSYLFTLLRYFGDI